VNAAWGHVAGAVTLFVMFLFLAIWAWAWLPRHKRTFEELSKIPMEDRMGDRDE
jgi:cytochrome c oxidase cbb3-type subunit 4